MSSRRREREHVAVDDPLELLNAGAEVVPDAGQRHVDDGVVEHRHREREAHRQQDDDLLASVVAFEAERFSPPSVSRRWQRRGVTSVQPDLDPYLFPLR